MHRRSPIILLYRLLHVTLFGIGSNRSIYSTSVLRHIPQFTLTELRVCVPFID